MKVSLKPKTKWGKLMLTLYVLAFVFSMAALCMTLHVLQTYPQAREGDEGTNALFQQYGYNLGSLIYILNCLALDFVFIVPAMLIIRRTDNTCSRYSYGFIRILAFAVIDGWIVSSLVNNFLDITNDAVFSYYYSIWSAELLKIGWFNDVVIYSMLPAFITVFGVSIMIRTQTEPRLDNK